MTKKLTPALLVTLLLCNLLLMGKLGLSDAQAEEVETPTSEVCAAFKIRYVGLGLEQHEGGQPPPSPTHSSPADTMAVIATPQEAVVPGPPRRDSHSPPLPGAKPPSEIGTYSGSMLPADSIPAKSTAMIRPVTMRTMAAVWGASAVLQNRTHALQIALTGPPSGRSSFAAHHRR